MSSMLTDNTFIPRGLFHYFNAGVTRDKALAYLLKSNEKNPKYFPRIDYREIDFWYNSFQNGNFDFSQEPTYPDLTKLENLPVLDHILYEINMEDQKSLRQVCTKFKTVIDTENRLYDKVNIHLDKSSITLQLKNGIDGEITKSIYKQEEEGCAIKTGQTKTVSSESFLKMALSDFKTTIRKVNTKVKNLTIGTHMGTISESIRNEFFAGISAIFKGLKSKLHVEKLFLYAETSIYLDGILGGIKERSLTWADVSVSNHSEAVFQLSHVSNFLSHLRYLTFLAVDKNNTDIKLASVVHVENVLMNFESITPEELSSYKKRVLESPHFSSHQFVFNDITDEGVEGFRNALAPFDSADDEFEENNPGIVLSGSFPIPGDCENVVEFKLYTFCIVFEITKIDLE